MKMITITLALALVSGTATFAFDDHKKDEKKEHKDEKKDHKGEKKDHKTDH